MSGRMLAGCQAIWPMCKYQAETGETEPGVTDESSCRVGSGRQPKVLGAYRYLDFQLELPCVCERE